MSLAGSANCANNLRSDGVKDSEFVENAAGFRSGAEHQIATNESKPDASFHGEDHQQAHPRAARAVAANRTGSAFTPNQLVIELAIEALDRREWPRSEAETRVARASLFAAEVLARDLIANGRNDEVEEIREFISTIVPDGDDASASRR